MVKALAIIAFLGGIGGLIHQRFWTSGGWFDWQQLVDQLCHEDLIVLCFVAGICLLIGRFK